MLNQAISKLQAWFPAPEVHAHCDGPCGVYDPSSARIAAEAVVSMTKKLMDLEMPAPGDKAATIAYNNTFSRYVAIKEEQAQIAKDEIAHPVD
jgi:nickel superoxide dismutase